MQSDPTLRPPNPQQTTHQQVDGGHRGDGGVHQGARRQLAEQLPGTRRRVEGNEQQDPPACHRKLGVLLMQRIGYEFVLS